MITLTQQQRHHLQEARNHATFETANFNMLERPIYYREADGTYTEVDATAFIRERTRIYMGCWVLPEIDAVLADKGWRRSQ